MGILNCSICFYHICQVLAVHGRQSVSRLSYFILFMMAQRLCSFLMPKVFLTVFIGSRVAALADRDQRGEMDSTSKLLNYSSVAVGILVGVGTGWYVFVLGKLNLE